MDLILLLWPAFVNVSMVWHRQLWWSELVLAVSYLLKILGVLLSFPPKHLEISTMGNPPWAETWQALSWAAKYIQSWSSSSKLSPTRSPPSCNVSLKPLLAQALLSLLGDLHQLPQPVLSTECLPRFCSPTGGWVLCLGTRTPLLDPAGTSSPLPRARRSFHCIFPVLTSFPWCYCWPLPDWQSGSASSAAVL